jgi:hypothetical protein
VIINMDDMRSNNHEEFISMRKEEFFGALIRYMFLHLVKRTAKRSGASWDRRSVVGTANIQAHVRHTRQAHGLLKHELRPRPSSRANTRVHAQEPRFLGNPILASNATFRRPFVGDHQDTSERSVQWRVGETSGRNAVHLLCQQ